MDRAKVIEGLENLRETIRTATPYMFTSGGICAMNMKRIDNALSLLKEQDTIVHPKPSRGMIYITATICDSCGAYIIPEDNFCRDCGKRIEWESR